MIAPPDIHSIRRQVQSALAEDEFHSDISGILIGDTQKDRALLICREDIVFCGAPWATEVFRQIDRRVQLEWLCEEGQALEANGRILQLNGPTRSLLAGERTALNFLQLLSGIATYCRQLNARTEGYPAQLFDTRKTLPGLRSAQKYAVRCGGGHNHRSSLAEAILLKENHLLALGSIREAVQIARREHPQKTVEVEVENLTQLQELLQTEADIALLDNFSLEDVKKAVDIVGEQILLEVSGNITEHNLHDFVATGVARISSGALTKNCRAADLSLRFL